MGRNIKEGLSYFPFDVDFFEDEKIQFVSAKFGIKADGIVARILCKIYRQGYSLKFDEDAALLFARSVGDINLHGLVRDVVNELLKRGFFNEPIFKRFGLLTSKGIQKRYTKICHDAKRKDWQIDPKLDLLILKPVFTPEEIIKTPAESTQIKEKKSKVNKSKELGADAPVQNQDVLDRFKNFQKWIGTNAPRVNELKEPLTIDQYLNLREKLGVDKLCSILIAMHNYKPLLSKSISANLTIQNWSKREHHNTETNEQPAGISAEKLQEEKSRAILSAGRDVRKGPAASS